MFGLFRSQSFRDGQLGVLHRSRKHWRGDITLPPCGTFRLSLVGGGAAPDEHAVEVAKQLMRRFQELMPEIQRGLFDHYAPYKDSFESSDDTRGCGIVASADVWPYVKPAHVLVERFQDAWTIDIAYKTDWDVEHTVAVIFRDWRYFGVNGSVRAE